MNLKLIISGGQTGADRAGLDFAREHGFMHAGFCPQGRRSEAGPIPSKYRLLELDTDDYRVRTELNVLTSDATLIFHGTPMGKGSALTARLCEEYNRPSLLINRSMNPVEAAEAVRKFVWARGARVLNVAGSRESKSPGIYAYVLDVLRRAHTADQPDS